jgi:hypothetical protein
LGRRAGQKPRLNFARDLEVALHDHAIRDLEHEQHEENEPGPEVGIELHGVDVALTAIFESAMRDDQKNQRKQQQHAARRREFLEYGPKEFLYDMQASPTPGKTFGRFRLNVARIKTITGASL